MKKIIYLIIVASLFFMCVPPKESDNCKIKVSFNNANFCLPELSGFTSCHNDSIVLEHFQDAYLNTKLVNVYLLTKEYKSFDTYKRKGFTDLVTVSISNDLEEVYPSKNSIDSLQSLLNSAFSKELYGKSLQEISDTSFSIVPYLIHKENLTNNSKTSFVLIKSIKGPLMMTVSLIKFKNTILKIEQFIDYNENLKLDNLIKKNKQILDSFSMIN